MLDAIIISDSGDSTFSASSPLRLHVDGKIALIQTLKNYVGNRGALVSPIEGERQDNWHSAPKLNGLAIYDYLRIQGFGTALIDSYFQEKPRFLELLRQQPKAVVISTTFILNAGSLEELVSDIRAAAPGITIIAGGPFVYSSYMLSRRSEDPAYDVHSPRKDYLFLEGQRDLGIDLLVVDKGGLQVLAEALGKLKTGSSIAGLPNTALWDGEKYVFSDRIDLDPTDFSIDWESLPDSVFNSRVANVQASIGCPYHCDFCNFVKDKRYTRVKPLDQLIAELKAVAARGIRYVRFVDDNFRLGRNDLDAVCRRFLAEDLGLKWMSFIRADTLDRADLSLLKRAGCIEAQMGIESADRTVLKKMRKDADPALYRRVIHKLLSEGIDCSCCFIAGFPGETEESFRRTIDFIEGIPNADLPGSFSWSMYPFLLVPLSPVYEPENRAAHGLEGYMGSWTHRTMDSRKAMDLVKEAFVRIGSASPIYSGDNLEMMQSLEPSRRKAFLRTRHCLSKEFLRSAPDKDTILRAFADLLD